MIGGSYIDNISQNESFRIYPNPANDVLTIKTNTSGLHTIEIISLNGQVIKSMKMDGPVQQIDLSSLEKGVYVIHIRSKDFVRTQKIIKL